MKKAPLPAPISSKKARWNSRKAAPCSWTRWGTWPWSCKSSSCGFSKSGRSSAWAAPGPSRSYHDAVAAFQRELLRQALAQAQGNHTAAAHALGRQRTYFHRLLTALGLRSPR